MFTTIMEKEIFEQPSAVKDCFNVNKEKINELVKLIKDKNPSGILIAARGSSDNAGTYFKYAVESLSGIPVALAAPSTNTLYGRKLNLNNYVVIGISQSGAAEDVMAVLSNAKEQNALTVSVTNNSESKMANMTDFHLYCACGEEKSVAATKTFTTEMYLLGLLAAGISGSDELYNGLAELSDKLKSVLYLKEDIKDLAHKYKEKTMFIVLARGLNFSIAQETSLKLQETCYVNARPYPASDFVHGPFALVDQNTNIIMLAPTGESMPDMMNLKKRLIETGANILIFTDDKDAASGCSDKVILPHADSDFYTPFYNVLVSQLFACYLSTAKGLNPDSPRGLKKVTITK